MRLRSLLLAVLLACAAVSPSFAAGKPYKPKAIKIKKPKTYKQPRTAHPPVAGKPHKTAKVKTPKAYKPKAPKVKRRA